MINDNKNWFALYTKPRHEFKAEEQLSKAGIISYLPTIIKLKQWSDRKKKVSEPVLRGYIFIYATESDRLEALEQSAVIRCICEHGRPAVIPEWQIENLRKMLAYKADYFIQEGLVSGTKVEIKEGPFAGVIGVVSSVKEGKTLAVSIDLLNRSVIAYLPKESVVKIID
jgi:transcription antitermination factor NusG